MPPPPRTAQINFSHSLAGFRVFFVLFLLAFLTSPTIAQDETSPNIYTWNGGNGDWNTPNRWNLNGESTSNVPGQSDAVIIESGTVKSSGDKVNGSDTLCISRDGTLTIGGGEDDATLELGTGSIYIGSGGATVKILTNGTLNVSNHAFYIGGSNSEIIIDGGAIAGNGNGSAILNTDANMLLESGAIKQVALLLAQASHFNMTGGTLTLDQLLIGVYNQSNAVADISGGDVTVKTNGIKFGNNGGTLNIIGSEATIKTSSLTVATSDSSLNFTAGGFNDEGQMFSTINATGTATIKGDISVNMTNFKHNGAMYFVGSPTQTLISAGTKLDYAPLNATTTATDGWNLEQIGNDLVLTLDESQFAVSYADATSGIGYGLGNFDTEGWVMLSGEADETVSLSLVYDGDFGEGGMDGFLKYLAESLPEDSGITVTDNGPFITFANLDLDQYGKGSLYYDLEGFNTKYGASMSFIDASNHIPEPSTWTLLILGATALVFMRRKR